MRSRNYHFDVTPTYSCGSPAAVEEATAMRVAADELRDYHAAREGIYGEQKQAQARNRGLSGIVLLMCDRANRWEAHDVITGQVHVWMFEPKCPKCGKKAHARRGVLQEHYRTCAGGTRSVVCDGTGQYVGQDYDHDEARERGLHPEFVPMEGAE